MLKNRGERVEVLKRGNTYISISTPKYIFKDAYLFTSPCSLSKYLKQNSVVETKSIFPYSYFNSIEELNRCKEFPAHSAFVSKLNNRNVSEEDYLEAKNEFDRRKSLQSSDPQKINSMVEWLIYYNELDTAPLAKAINNSFENFFKIFGLDPSFCLTLPKFAQQCMFRMFDPSSPFCYSFYRKQSEVRELTRENLTGGLVNVFHRCIDLSGRPDMPRASQFAPNGNPFTSLMFFDFNSLYLHAQLQPFPATPGKIEYFKSFVNPGAASLNQSVQTRLNSRSVYLNNNFKVFTGLKRKIFSTSQLWHQVAHWRPCNG